MASTVLGAQCSSHCGKTEKEVTSRPCAPADLCQVVTRSTLEAKASQEEAEQTLILPPPRLVGCPRESPVPRGHPPGQAVQLQNTYTLKGFSVGSKCVVWSSLRNTWSKCEILELAEEGTRVVNLSNGVEETVSPENVWNGIPKVDKNRAEAVFQTVGKDLSFMSSDDTTIKEEQHGGDADSTLEV